MIEVRNLKKSYKDKLVLDRINLTLENGKTFGLVGRNGVGKTTLMKILSNQICEYEGNVKINGVDIKNDKSFKEDIAIISDDFISENQNGEKLKTLISSFKTLSPNFNQKRFDELMTLFNIDKKKRYDKLSFGNKSLFRTIIGLSSGAKYLYLDEPATGLDEINKDMLYKKILSYQDHDNSTIILSSHILKDIEKIADDVIILKGQKVIINDSVEALSENSLKITLNPNDLSLLDGKNIIHTNNIGGQVIAYVYDRFTRAELENLRAKSVVQPMPLDELFKSLNMEV